MPRDRLSYSDAIRDARLQVRLWQMAPHSYRDRIRSHVARALRCSPGWWPIQAAIVRQPLDDAERLAA